MPVIEIQGLHKRYGDTVAVHDVSLSVEEGEIFGVLGPNGAGKTTTVETVAGLRPRDGGSVTVLGLDPQRDGARLRREVGVQLQESQLPDRITVREALDLFASFYEDPADPAELIDALGLGPKAGALFRSLSGGQKQRLSIALALIGNPRIAILDELTTGLDPQARRDTWQVIEDVRGRGVTIVLVTHFMEEAERLCDRVAVIDRGRVAALGTVAELTGGGANRLVFSLPAGADAADADALAAMPEVTSLRRSGNRVEVTGGRTVLPAVVLALHERGVVPEDLQTQRTSLDDVFVSLTAHDAPQEV